jgi:hypothetical protein
MRFRSARAKAVLLVFGCTAATFLFMWPRLVDAHFGLLDDGVMLSVSRQILERPGYAFSIGTRHGRFVPGFWLYFAGVYGVVGPSPTGFYAANSFVLAGLVSVTALLVRRVTGSVAFAAATAFCVLSVGAVPEAFYTLSKAEPTQSLCLLSAVYLALRAGDEARGAWPFGAAAVACLVAAALLKETTVVVLPILAAWAVVARLSGTWRAPERRRFLLVLTGGAVAALALFIVARATVLPAAAASGSYAANFRVSPDRLAVNAVRWTGWLLHDYPYVFVLAAAVAARLRSTSTGERELLAGSLVWMGGWAAIYLPWHSVLQYYLLPFGVGAAVFSATAAGVLAREAWSRRSVTAGAPVAIAAVLMAGTLASHRTQAALQLAIDRSNAALVDRLAELPHSSRIYVNLPKPNEYAVEIGVFLREQRGRRDLVVDYFAPKGVALVPGTTQVVATPVMRNQARPSVRIPVSEGGATAAAAALASAAPQASPRGAIRNSVRLVDVGYHRLLPLSSAGRYDLDARVPRRFLDTRRFEFGWDLATLPAR